jgi:hypothetical protein
MRLLNSLTAKIDHDSIFFSYFYHSRLTLLIANFFLHSFPSTIVAYTAIFGLHLSILFLLFFYRIFLYHSITLLILPCIVIAMEKIDQVADENAANQSESSHQPEKKPTTGFAAVLVGEDLSRHNFTR